MKSLAVEFVAPRQVALTEVDVASPEVGEALVRTLYSGISAGTEMLAYRGDIDPQVPLDETLPSLGGKFAFPFRYGYSSVGRVEASRGDVSVGSLVFAFHPHQQLFVEPASSLVPVDDVDPRLATLFPLMETALQISLDAGPLHEEHVALFGLGAVGILAGALLVRAGAHVVGAEPREWRRRAAERFGIEAVAPAELSDLVLERTDGRGCPLVVEASGSVGALSDALGLLAHEGTALVASWYGSKAVPLPLGLEFHRRRLSIRSSQVSTIPARQSHRWSISRRRAVARRLLHDLPLEHLATHTWPLEDAPRAFAAVDRAEDGLIHGALSYEAGGG